MERKAETSKNAEIDKEGYILILCGGNAFRSQYAELLLDSAGVHCMSAAVRDISKQHYQGDIPLHIQGLFWKMSFDLNEIKKKKMKQVTEKMANNAIQILAFCEKDELPDFIKPDDERLHLHTTYDPNGPKNIDRYKEALTEVALATRDFVADISSEPDLNNSEPLDAGIKSNLSSVGIVSNFSEHSSVYCDEWGEWGFNKIEEMNKQPSHFSF